MATDFDVDKHLKEFAAELREVGCSIKDIGIALRDQPEELKDKNWNAVAKKKELTNFVEIYTVVLSVIAYALKRKQISYKPSQSCIKALTMKVIAQLPQENEKALLTQFDYVNNFHNILNAIHEEIDPTIGAPPSSIATNIFTHLETSEQQRWEVGTRCKANNYQKNGKDYDGKTCVVLDVYNETFGYFVRFHYDQLTMYVPADQLECLPTETDMDEPGETDALSSDHSEIELGARPSDFGNNYDTATTSNDRFHIDFDCLPNVDCSDVKDRARECTSAPTEWVGAHLNLVIGCICFIVLVCIASATIHGGRMKVVDGEEYAQSSTEEMCLILSYERNKCEFECGSNGCSNYKSKYGDNVYDCDRDSGEDDCKSYDYTYTATVDSKCGSAELYSNDFDVEENCNGNDPLEIGVEVSCYVLECGKQEFTIHDASKFAASGNGEIIGGSIWLGIMICCCLCYFGIKLSDQ